MASPAQPGTPCTGQYPSHPPGNGAARAASLGLQSVVLGCWTPGTHHETENVKESLGNEGGPSSPRTLPAALVGAAPLCTSQGSSRGQRQPQTATVPLCRRCGSTASQDVPVSSRNVGHKSLGLRWELAPGHVHGSPLCSPCQREQAGHRVLAALPPHAIRLQCCSLDLYQTGPKVG